MSKNRKIGKCEKNPKIHFFHNIFSTLIFFGGSMKELMNRAVSGAGKEKNI